MEGTPAEALRTDVLRPLVGRWIQQVHLPGVPPGTVDFEWGLGKVLLLERSLIPHPDVPDSLSVITVNETSGGFTQHYFDSRGVVRLYRMRLADGVWTLHRTAPDFTPLDFSQRFVGIFSADGAVIDGRWETSDDGGEHWELDFPITYTRDG